MNNMEMIICGQHFTASPAGTLFWQEQQLLMIADAHFSKEMHFRKSGIAIPGGILQNDLKKMDALIAEFDPSEILFLGDMFHSEMNEGVTAFLEWRKRNAALRCSLVIGNHDILDAGWYAFAGIAVTEDQLQIDNIIFSHEKLTQHDADCYNFSGHIHPGFSISGKAKQKLRLPCFWFGKAAGVLPAFGRFTGSVAVNPRKGDTIIAIGENALFKMEIK